MGQVRAMPQRTVKQPCMARFLSAIVMRITRPPAVVSAPEPSHGSVSMYRPLLTGDCLDILLVAKLQDNVLDACLKVRLKISQWIDQALDAKPIQPS